MIVLLFSILLMPDQFPFGITPCAVGPIPGCALDLVLFSVLFRYKACPLPQLTGDLPLAICADILSGEAPQSEYPHNIKRLRLVCEAEQVLFIGTPYCTCSTSMRSRHTPV